VLVLSRHLCLSTFGTLRTIFVACFGIGHLVKVVIMALHPQEAFLLTCSFSFDCGSPT